MTARLIAAEQIAPRVRHFVFEAENGPLAYQPGQFVSFTQKVNGAEITRAYSIASAPGAGNRFEICLNLVEDGQLSPYLFAMRPGDRIAMTPPLGTFVLRNPPRDSILIATGTGIAPFRAYLQAYLPKRKPGFTLLFGARYEEDLLYRKEFEALAAAYSHFRFWPTLTRPGPGWRGRVGRVQSHLEEAAGGRTDLDFYLCGLKAMVDDVRAILKGMGFDRRQIRTEKYD